MKQHKWAKEIHAWADGAQIQYNYDNSGWRDIDYPSWIVTENNLNKYRVKPDTNKYRVALFFDGVSYYWTKTADNHNDESHYQEHKYFNNWLTDWIEYEV